MAAARAEAARGRNQNGARGRRGSGDYVATRHPGWELRSGQEEATSNWSRRSSVGGRGGTEEREARRGAARGGAVAKSRPLAAPNGLRGESACVGGEGSCLRSPVVGGRHPAGSGEGSLQPVCTRLGPKRPIAWSKESPPQPARGPISESPGAHRGSARAVGDVGRRRPPPPRPPPARGPGRACEPRHPG